MNLNDLSDKQLQDQYMSLMYNKSMMPLEKFKHSMKLVLNEMYRRCVKPPKEEDWEPGE